MNEDLIRSRLRTMQIIAGALMAGIVTFAAIAVTIGLTGKDAPAAEAAARAEPQLPMLSIMVCGWFVAACLAAFVVPAGIVRAGVQSLAAQAPSPPDEESGRLLALYQTKLIVYCALFEGAAFFGLMVLMSEKSPWSLGVPAASLAAIALAFPTFGRVSTWLEQQQLAVEQARRDRR